MPDPQTERLNAIRRRQTEASTDWQFRAGNDGEQLTARVIPVDDPYTVLTFAGDCTYADREAVCHAHDDKAFLLDLVDNAFTVIRQLRRALERHQPKPKDYAAEMAMKVKDPAFQLYMQVNHAVDNSHDPMRVENAVKRMLRITSKKELVENSDAAHGWRDLVRNADDWNRSRSR